QLSHDCPRVAWSGGSGTRCASDRSCVWDPRLHIYTLGGYLSSGMRLAPHLPSPPPESLPADELRASGVVGVVLELLDQYVGARIDRAHPAVLPTHQIGAGAVFAEHLEDLAVTWVLTLTVAVNDQTVAGGDDPLLLCAHRASCPLTGSFLLGGSRSSVVTPF